MEVYNFHFLAIPLFDSHTGENMINVVAKFLDALYMPWRNILVSALTDGARSITGRIQGLATRSGKCTTGKLIRIWCGLHHLNFTMQSIFKAALNENFYSAFTTLIDHLHRQQNLISQMRTTCPKVADTRWNSMYSCTSWLTNNIIAVQQHLFQKQSRCGPPIKWWIFVFAVHAVALEACAIFTELQELTTLLSMQRAKLLHLIDTYCRMSQMVRSLTADQLADIDRFTSEVHRSFCLSHDNAQASLDGFYLYVG